MLIRSIPSGEELALAAPLGEVNETVRNVVGVTWVLVPAVVVLVLSLLLSRGVCPFEDLIATAGLIAAGDLSQRVEVGDATSEVGQLGRARKSTLAKIDVSFEAKVASAARLRQFVANAAHELRTPLPFIRG